VEQKVNFIIKEKTPLTTATIHPQGVRAKVAIVDTRRKKVYYHLSFDKFYNMDKVMT